MTWQAWRWTLLAASRISLHCGRVCRKPGPGRAQTGQRPWLRAKDANRFSPAWIPDTEERHERPQLRIAPPPIVASTGQLEQRAPASSVLGLRRRSAPTPISICAACPAFSGPRRRFGPNLPAWFSVATVCSYANEKNDTQWKPCEYLESQNRELFQLPSDL